MGIFDILTRLPVFITKKFIQSKIQEKKKSENASLNEKNLFNDWLDNVLKEEISNDVIAFNFNIYEDSDEKYRLELIGSSSYDKDNDNWACDEMFSSRNNTYVLDNEYSKGKYKDVECDVIKLVRKYMYVGKYKEKLEQSHAVCCGFVDGDLEIIYSNEKYRKIIDYKSIDIKSFNETLDFIKNNNVLWSKIFMQKKLDVQLNGYVKNIFEKEYDELLNKNIITNFKGMAYESSTMAPGAIISKFGYIVINGTSGGDVICMDLNSSLDNPRIVFADHSIFCGIQPYIRNEEIWTKDLVDHNVKVVRNTFEEYVNDIKNGKLDIEELDLV